MPDDYRADTTSFIVSSKHAALSRNCRDCHLSTIHHYRLVGSDPHAWKSLDLYLVTCRGGLTQDGRHLLGAPNMRCALNGSRYARCSDYRFSNMAATLSGKVNGLPNAPERNTSGRQAKLRIRMPAMLSCAYKNCPAVGSKLVLQFHRVS